MERNNSNNMVHKRFIAIVNNNHLDIIENDILSGKPGKKVWTDSNIPGERYDYRGTLRSTYKPYLRVYRSRNKYYADKTKLLRIIYLVRNFKGLTTNQYNIYKHLITSIKYKGLDNETI